MRTCGLWQVKLRTCGCGLFLILVRNPASFIPILKFIFIFKKYLCFYQVKLEKSIKFFRVQVWQKYQVFRVQADKNTRSAFWLNRFRFVNMLFFQVRQNNRLLSSLSANLQPGFKVWLCCFLPWIYKISHWCIIFCIGSQCRRYGGASSAVSPLTTTCAPPFRFTQNAFLEHHVTTRQQTMMEKGIITFKHDSRLKFSRLFAK